MDLPLWHSDKKSKAMPCRHRPGVKTGARPTEAGAQRARHGAGVSQWFQRGTLRNWA